MHHIKFPSPTPRSAELTFAPYKYPVIATTYLPIPEVLITISLTEALDHRYSQRHFARLPTTKLNTLLWHSSRTRASRRESSGFLWQHRTAPSGGGRHPIDILVIEGGEKRPSLQLYDPIGHALHMLNVDAQQIEELVKKVDHIVTIQEGTILWFVAQVERTLSKYEHGESLIWRDAGALVAIQSVVAAALGLCACAIGATYDVELESMFHASETLMSVGAMLIGVNPQTNDTTT